MSTSAIRRLAMAPLFAVLALLMATSLLHPVAAASGNRPFALGVRDSLMIGHSFHDHPAFGPAGGMHGATYTCDVEFRSRALVEDTNWVIDIGLALSILSEVLARYNLKNLDEVFPDGTLTTTEFMCRVIHEGLCEKLKERGVDFPGGEICVKLWESHKAWASYAADV